MKNLYFFCSIFILSVLVSCDESEFKQDPPEYTNGAFVVNEGTFGNGNASVSFIGFDDDSIRNEIFYEENQRPVGDVLQSLTISDNFVYLIVNNSNKVEVATTSSFREKGVITELSAPRYMAVSGNKGYISQWGNNGSVAVADLTTYSTIKTIAAGTGPEGIIVAGNEIWVANGGGLALDSTVMVIDPATDQVTDTITVGYNPKEMVTDKQGDVWVLCYGHITYNNDWSIAAEFPSKLYKISANNKTISKEIPIGASLHPQHLDIDGSGSNIFVGGGFGFNGIYKISVNASDFPEAPVIEGYFYAFNVNPVNGEIYACEAPDFTSPGIVKIFSSEGAAQTEYTVGIGPNAVIFR